MRVGARIGLRLAEAAVIMLGQAAIGFALQQAAARAAYTLDERRRRKTSMGFAPQIKTKRGIR